MIETVIPSLVLRRSNFGAMLEGVPLVRRTGRDRYSLTTMPNGDSGADIALALHQLCHRQGLCQCDHSHVFTANGTRAPAMSAAALPASEAGMTTAAACAFKARKQVTCGKCGGVGHNARNASCPLFSITAAIQAAFPAPACTADLSHLPSSPEILEVE